MCKIKLNILIIITPITSEIRMALNFEPILKWKNIFRTVPLQPQWKVICNLIFVNISTFYYVIEVIFNASFICNILSHSLFVVIHGIKKITISYLKFYLFCRFSTYPFEFGFTIVSY